MDKLDFYFLATEELESQSMKRLAGVVARTTKNTLLQKATFTDWMDLFQMIADYKPEEKKVYGCGNKPLTYDLSTSISEGDVCTGLISDRLNSKHPQCPTNVGKLMIFRYVSISGL